LEKPEEGSVRALDKALSVLEHLSRYDRDVDLATLTREMRMPKTTILRLLGTLRRHNLVHQDGQTKRFRLGWALIYLGRAASRVFNLVDFIHPYLERLSRSSGETANLVFLDRDRAVYVDQVVSDNIIRGVPAVGAPLGLHCTASGKALLSAHSPQRLEQTLEGLQLYRLTAKTITDAGELRRQIERAREQGVAFDDEESELGGRCVAAPVFGNEGTLVGAISVMGPTNRVNPETFPGLTALVRETAGEISTALGFRQGPAGRGPLQPGSDPALPTPLNQ
jgi:IclR family KDG regulon transcriptional repressor